MWSLLFCISSTSIRSRCIALRTACQRRCSSAVEIGVLRRSLRAIGNPLLRRAEIRRGRTNKYGRSDGVNRRPPAPARPKAALLHRPIVRMPIGQRAIAPVEIRVVELAWTAAQFVERCGRLIRLASRVEVQRTPFHRIVVPLHGQKPAGMHHRVGDLSAHLVEHQPLDRADLLAVAAVYGGAFHMVAGDQGVCHGDLPCLCRDGCRSRIMGSGSPPRPCPDLAYIIAQAACRLRSQGVEAKALTRLAAARYWRENPVRWWSAPRSRRG